MNLNSHPHPYAVFIGGNGMGTSSQTELYCAAVGNGKFIVRGFGPEPFRMTGLLSESNAAIHKAAGRGQPVTQDISLSVKGDKVVCSINGWIVANYDKGTLECAIPPESSAIRTESTWLFSRLLLIRLFHHTTICCGRARISSFEKSTGRTRSR